MVCSSYNQSKDIKLFKNRE